MSFYDPRSRNQLITRSDVQYNDSNFAVFTQDGEVKQGSITQCLSKDLEDATKEHLDLIYTQNEEGCFNHNMERLSWHNTETSNAYKVCPTETEFLRMTYSSKPCVEF